MKTSKQLEHPKICRVINHFGGILALAKALKIKPQAIYQWKDIPEQRAYQIHLLTKGKIPLSYLLRKSKCM